MTESGSYSLNSFTNTRQAEIERLAAQVDLFWDNELALYRRLGLKDGLNIIECGSGSGHLVDRLLAIFPDLRATAMEIDPLLIEASKASLLPKYSDRCRILRGDIMKTELPDDSFDITFARMVVEHLPDPSGALRELKRITKPHGLIIVADNDFDYHIATFPSVPALRELYRAYCQARREQGGSPTIGKELPFLMKGAGLTEVDFNVVCAHSAIASDLAFLKSEGAGISSQLVKDGYLSTEAMNQLAVQWVSMLAAQNHAILRMIFVASGKKETAPAEISQTMKKGEDAPKPAASQIPRTENEVSSFITAFIAQDLNVASGKIDLDQSFLNAGLDSLGAVKLCAEFDQFHPGLLSAAEILSDKTIRTVVRLVFDRITLSGKDSSREIKDPKSAENVKWEEGEV